MYGLTFIGLFSVILSLLAPILMIFVTIWVYKIKKNSDAVVESQKEIIALLKKD